MLIGSHLGDLVQADTRRSGPEHVGALQRTAHPALGDDSEHPAVNETGDVPVQAGHWHVGQLGLKF